MSEKMSTKCANKIDSLLSQLDLTRKGIVKNDSCVFRAVSERLFNTQFFHDHVKKTCLDYLLRHVDEYQPFVKESIRNRIRLLEERKVSAGHLEMIVLSRFYRLDFLVFLPSPFGHFNLTQNSFSKQISLCYMDSDHYDLVYPKDYTHVAAFCQSIIYELLYKNIFGLDSEIEEAVIFLQLQKHLTKDFSSPECAFSDALSLLGQEKQPVLERISGRSSPPLPYRVAKALHPALLRNVELDIVHEELREERFRKQAYFRRFVPGDKCQVTLSDDESKSYHGHIQELDEDGETVVVYIEELTVKKTLPTSCVKPLPIQLSQAGNQAVLPVAEIDLLSFLRKGRRKKAMPIAVSPEPIRSASVPSSNTSSQYPDKSQSPHHYSPLSEKRHSFSRASSRNYQQRQYTSQQCLSSTANNSDYRAFSTCGTEQHFESNNLNKLPNPSAHTSPPAIRSTCSPLGQSCPIEPPGYLVTNGSLPGPLALTPCPPSIPVEESCVVTPGFDPYYCTTYVQDMSQPAPSQGPMYLMPVMAVPYASNMGHVNVNWTPSHDPYGKDLPLSDVNTLRFFFNLGVEYYRMPSCGQQPPPTSYGPGLMYIPPEVVSPPSTHQDINNNNNHHHHHHSVPTTGIYTDGFIAREAGVTYLTNEAQAAQASASSGESRSSKAVYTGNGAVGGKRNDKCSKMNEEGKSSVLPNKLAEIANNGGDYCHSQKTGESVVNKDKTEIVSKEKEKSVEGEDSGSDQMDVGSDGDSGCPSECADLSPISGTDAEFVATDSTSNAGDASSTVTENGKPKGKRRYYMYGNHKLIKPIKEIPLRFQMLLAETSAAKARCEGQPIYMQQPAQVAQPSYDIVYYHTPEGAQSQQQPQSLNANATCFVPNQNAADCGTISYISDDYSVCSMPNFPGNSTGASLQPAPLFVPPPPTVLNQTPSNSSQQCPAFIMYSTASTASSFPQNLQSSPVCTPSTQTLQHAQPISVPPPFPPPSSVPPPSMDTSSINYPPTVTQLKPAFPVNSAPCPSPLSIKSGMKANAASNPLTLNIPPTNVAMPKTASHTVVVNSLSTPAVNTTAPPPNACIMPMASNMYSGISHPSLVSNPHAASTNMPVGLVPQAPPPSTSNPTTAMPASSVPSSSACLSYPPSNSGNQYMYVYPSTPTGPPTNPPQGAVMYMVSPAYPTTNYPSPAFQQPGLIMPSVATQ